MVIEEADEEMLSVSVMTYNEAKRPAGNIEELISTLEEHLVEHQVIRVVNYKENKGKGYALKYGSCFL